MPAEIKMSKDGQFNCVILKDVDFSFEELVLELGSRVDLVSITKESGVMAVSKLLLKNGYVHTFTLCDKSSDSGMSFNICFTSLTEIKFLRTGLIRLDFVEANLFQRLESFLNLIRVRFIRLFGFSAV